MSKYIGILNEIAGSATMLTWYQGNFIRVLDRFAGSEAMSGERRGEEHTLDSTFLKYQ